MHNTLPHVPPVRRCHSPKIEAPGSKVTVSFPALVISLSVHRQLLHSWINWRHLRINLVLSGKRAHSQNAVFTLQPDLDAWSEILRNEGGNADAKIHVKAIFELLCCALCYSAARALFQKFLG
jgi:hypothetical protein